MIKKAFTITLSAVFMLGLVAGCGGQKSVKKSSSQKSAKKSRSNGDLNNYLVRKGDSLWRIAAKPSVMGDPFRWPLLFKSNRDQIEDPDIIDVRQDLGYKQSYSRSEIRDAVEKAQETPPYVPHSKPRRVLPVKY